jgi:DNA-directed RNA polymerase I, II, and III subunit RPABC3
MNTIIEDKFTVNGVNKDGKFFKKVSRIDAKSEIYDIEMTLDINSEIYQMEMNKDYYVVIATGISSSDGKFPP